MTDPLVSIVIRARNEERLLGRTLEMIDRQTVASREVIVVDSGSVDRTVAIARAAGARILSIQPQDFTYGRALNVGAAAASGRFLVNLSAHAVPVDEQWLAALLTAHDDAIAAGHDVAGVYGRQVPLPDAAPFVAREYVVSYGSVPRVTGRQPFFSNSNALLPRALWLDAPFDEQLPYCEDMAWMSNQQRAGRVSVYAPHAAVLHSHDETLVQVYRRSRNEGAAYRMIADERWTAVGTLAGWFHEARADQRFFTEAGIGWSDRSRWVAPSYRLARLLGGFVGRRRPPAPPRAS